MSSIYNLLEFTNLTKIESLSKNNKYKEELKDFGIDSIHFSGEFPTIFFKEINQFNSETLVKIAEIQHKLWNYKKVMFLYVTSLTEIRIYNCTNEPFDYKSNPSNIENKINEYELARSNISEKSKLKEILEIFSLSAIDSGSIWNRPNNYIKQINLKKRIDNFLVASLVTLANELEREGLSLNIIHSLIMRSLFIMYLEDKGATPPEFYKDYDCYFNLLDDKESTYLFFNKIQENFNGNIFPVSDIEKDKVEPKHLKLLKQCFINGDIKNETLFKEWRIFKFDIIDIELLSQIYENFLSEINKTESGSYYTPPSLVELMLNEVLPVENETNYNVKILDPTCGSGIFLVEAYKRIVQRWHNAHPDKSINFITLKKLMIDNIYGIELNSRSIKVATFSLYLALLDFLYPKTLWYQGKEKFPYLINDKENNLNKQGYNLFIADTIDENKEFEKNYNVIVGNPPYGKTVPTNIKKYCNENNFAVEFVIPFIHKSTILAPDGKIALLMPTKLLTNTKKTSQNFRKWLFNENYVEKIYNLSILRNTPKNYGGQLFSSAIVPASIIFFKNKTPKKQSNSIEYWAPKSYIKNNIAEGVLIDSSDIKYLPRNECQKVDTKIWKIAQWGSLQDFTLFKNLKINDTLKIFFDNNNITDGVGLELSNPCNKPDNEIKNIPHMGVKSVELYNTNIDKTITITNTKFRRKGKQETYKAPHILIKEGIKKVSNEARIVSSFLDYKCSYYKGIIGIYNEDKNLLKSLTVYLNSNFTKYFMFLTSSSWGIERDIIKANELFLLPSFFENKLIVEKLSILYDEIQSKINNNYPLFPNIIDIENKILEIILESLKLSNNEKILVAERMIYILDLFYKGKDSIALQSINYGTPETIGYSSKLCEELNETLEESELKVISTVYKNSYYSPLCLVVIQFIDKSDDNFKSLNMLDTNSEFNEILSKLNKYTLDEYSKGIYIQKNLTYYDDDKIYIVKPNQKRFWNLSSAIEDVQCITLEVMSMPE